MGSFPATHNDPNYVELLDLAEYDLPQLFRSRRVLSVSADR